MINRTERAESLMAYDRQYRLADIVVAGMDEVGRGPLAGNVVTACVVMPEEPLIVWIDDSKKLSESRREKVYEEILPSMPFGSVSGKCLPMKSMRLIFYRQHEKR